MSLETELHEAKQRIISLKAACSLDEYDTADYITHVHKANDELRAKVEKIEGDTGGGCSVCGQLPAINIDGAYWLCRGCISERLDELQSFQTLSQGTIDAISSRLRLMSLNHMYSIADAMTFEEAAKELHKAMYEAVYKVKMD